MVAFCSSAEKTKGSGTGLLCDRPYAEVGGHENIFEEQKLESNQIKERISLYS